MSKGMWTRHYTPEEGKTFYYNANSNRSLWLPPKDSIIHEAANAPKERDAPIVNPKEEGELENSLFASFAPNSSELNKQPKTDDFTEDFISSLTTNINNNSKPKNPIDNNSISQETRFVLFFIL